MDNLRQRIVTQKLAQVYLKRLHILHERYDVPIEEAKTRTKHILNAEFETELDDMFVEYVGKLKALNIEYGNNNSTSLIT